MANLNGFDANDYEPHVGFSPIPAGEYEVAMTESEMKPANNNPEHSYLECIFKIISGKHKGRSLYERLNLVNSNPECVRIARQKLSAICNAVGVLKPGDSTSLHNCPLIAKVKLVKRKDNGEDANEIDVFSKKPSSLQGQTTQAAQDEQEEKPEWEN